MLLGANVQNIRDITPMKTPDITDSVLVEARSGALSHISILLFARSRDLFLILHFIIRNIIKTE